MGKSKSRILYKGKNDRITNITRDEAVQKTAKYLNSAKTSDAMDLITMFGLGAEEILEAGADYEAVIAIKNIFVN